MARASVLLLLLCTHATAGEFTSLADAKRRATQTRQPVLCVLLESGNRASTSLEKMLGRNPVKKELAGFLLVKLQRGKNLNLVAKYGLKYSPSTIVFSSVGSPMKLIVGPTSASKYAKQLRAAKIKHKELWNPPRPTKPPDRRGTERSVPPRPHSRTCPEGCPSCTPAIRRSLKWLATRQQADGRWSKPKAEREMRTPEGKRLTRSIDEIDIALTALAGLALLAEGDDYAPQVEKAKRFLLATKSLPGLFAVSRDPIALTYTHFETPLAAIFLAELYARAPDPVLKQRMVEVAAYLARAQDPRTGAWGYAPDFKDHPQFTRAGWRLLATTYSCTAALNHLRDAGIEVDGDAIRRATRYLLKCVGKNGAFVYRTSDKGLDGTPGQSAGALYALLRAGASVDPKILDRHRRHYRRLDAFGEHEWFFLLFTGLLMHGQSAGAADDFHRSFRDVLLHDQQQDGHWDDADKKGGSVLATAIAAIALQLPRGKLLIASRRPAPKPVRVTDKPRYLAVPHESSRVKVFERDGRYWVDLIISLDRPADAAYVSALRAGIEGANRRLFDVTDGQMSIHRAEIHAKKGRWNEADIMITNEFRDRETNPHPFAHGMTWLKTVTDIKNNREKKRRRIGDWIMFPPEGIAWDTVPFQHVFAHELCHYLFGVRDEYHQRTGESFCACIVGRRGFTELCTEHSHTDDRRDADCWTLAKALYPKLKIPKEVDPGPWDPPRPVISFK